MDSNEELDAIRPPQKFIHERVQLYPDKRRRHCGQIPNVHLRLRRCVLLSTAMKHPPNIIHSMDGNQPPSETNDTKNALNKTPKSCCLFNRNNLFFPLHTLQQRKHHLPPQKACKTNRRTSAIPKTNFPPVNVKLRTKFKYE